MAPAVHAALPQRVPPHPLCRLTMVTLSAFWSLSCSPSSFSSLSTPTPSVAVSVQQAKAALQPLPSVVWD